MIGFLQPTENSFTIYLDIYFTYGPLVTDITLCNEVITSLLSNIKLTRLVLNFKTKIRITSLRGPGTCSPLLEVLTSPRTLT